MSAFQGWLMDVYPSTEGGLSLWVIKQNGERRIIHQNFSVKFYAHGASKSLQALNQYLHQKHGGYCKTIAEEKRDAFREKPVRALGIIIEDSKQQQKIFWDIQKEFPKLRYYDADLTPWIRHSAVYGTFPMVYCEFLTDEGNHVQDIVPLDTPWDLESPLPPLKILKLSCARSPAQEIPKGILVDWNGQEHFLSYAAPRPLLINLSALIRRCDPDIILSDWGDTWLLPELQKLAEQFKILLPLNRDETMPVGFHPQRSYVSYGQLVYKAQKLELFGRVHIDRKNTIFWDDYALEGILETARVTGLSIQDAARLSPGTGISNMQIREALKQNILVPYHKHQVETPRSAEELMRFDRGGLIYQPLIGVHTNVGEIDFVSMYPSIMIRYGISPELEHIPMDEIEKEQAESALIPATLSPLLQKRMLIKQRLAEISMFDPRRQADEARISAYKWLLVTCFGYLGYKNARFGKINLHERVTSTGREVLLTAKEVAEEMGFTLLHMYVDGLWIHKDNCRTMDDYQPLLEQIAKAIGLSISMNGIFRWICFLPSKENKQIPIANRYFGVYENGKIKVRGIEARRRDTPSFIVDTQLGLIQELAEVTDPENCDQHLARALQYLRKRLNQLREKKVPLQELLVSNLLSKKPEEYRVLSPSARAARQIQASTGREIAPGERIQFIYIDSPEKVHAWEQFEEVNIEQVDWRYYQELTIRAAETILEPFGIPAKLLHSLAAARPAYQLDLFENMFN